MPPRSGDGGAGEIATVSLVAGGAPLQAQEPITSPPDSGWCLLQHPFAGPAPSAHGDATTAGMPLK
jgi:hypothetical protein